MFERSHHQRIARVLTALDGRVLRDNACLFGGGTAIALRYGEYRESVDIDFLVSDVAGYRNLRQLLTGLEGIAAITRDRNAFTQARDVRADQYGVRTTLALDGQDIKFEIVLEGRVELAKPAAADVICGIATLKPLDMATTKLLANSDRWADDGVFSRDLIDMAMMSPKPDLLTRAIEKAEGAYGKSVTADLGKAIDQLRSRHGRLERCMQAMGMQMPTAVLWQKIRLIERALKRM
jgi:Nucleotidyl transferase AbiEii toxin, Type IV TA system